MRLSEFEAIRPQLQEASDRIDADLKRTQALVNDEGLHELFNQLAVTEGAPSDLSRSFPRTPLIQDAYPWRHIATEAAVWLREVGLTTEANAIELELSRLPTGPVDGNQPDNMARDFATIRAKAERIKTILTTCLEEQAPAAKPDGSEDKGGTGKPPPPVEIGNENQETRIPVCQSKAVKLFGPGEQPVVNGEREPILTRARYDAVQALIEAGETGLTKDQLDTKSGHSDARKLLKAVAKVDRNWEKVLRFPETPGKRYRIL